MKSRLAGISVFFIAGSFVFAHTLDIEVFTGGAGFAARYADGTPAAGAEVKIYSPEGATLFQQGYTDLQGSFVFRPTTTGLWKIEVDDGMGHRLEQTMEVGPEGAVASGPRRPLGAGWPAVAGVGIIWGLFGTYGWWKASRKRA